MKKILAFLEHGGVMRHLATALGVLLASTQGATAQSVKPIFEGLGMVLTKGTDQMTDAQVCSLSVNEGLWRVAVMGPDQFAILAGNDKLLFAPDEQHLIRIGSDKAQMLAYVANRNALVAGDPLVAASIIRAMVRGEDIKVRYFDFPGHKSFDGQLTNPNVGYGYQLGVNECGWKPVGGSGDLAPVEVNVYNSKQFDGHATATVKGNPDLSLNKGGGSYPSAACSISVGIDSLFGRKWDQWVFDKVDASGRTSVVVSDSGGNAVFSTKIPTQSPGFSGVNPFPEAEAVARAAWKLAPTGTISLEPLGRSSRVAVLYGFRELWTWGVQNCGLPTLD